MMSILGKIVVRIKGLFFFCMNLYRYVCVNTDRSFRVTLHDIWFRTFDRFKTAAYFDGDYFYQDLWAAQWLYDHAVRDHVDVASRVDGFVAHILPFCKVTYIDIRPLKVNNVNFKFLQGSILELPFADNSVESLSCLHVLDHVGLGRYGDMVDPDSYTRAARELERVLKPGGVLLLSVPVGRQRLCFDAHRVFDPQTIVNLFPALTMGEFSLIDDAAAEIQVRAFFESARQCEYGCGLFAFQK